MERLTLNFRINLDQKKLPLYLFILSLGAHLCFLPKNVSLVFSPNSENEEKKIVLRFNPQSKVSKQIVRTEESKNNQLAKKAYLSEKTNTFDRQTRAQKVGTFRRAGFGQKDGISDKTTKGQKSKNKNIGLKDLGVNPTLVEVAPKGSGVQSESSVRKGLETGDKSMAGLSQSNDYLNKVPLGDFTKLNTQEFEFYGFYNRIRQKLEQFWGNNIRDEAQKIYKSGRSIASGKNHLTSLVIELNSKGEITNVKMKASSGLKELDQAAVKSFNQAGPFPNPPKKMLRNGKAILEWGFVVNT